MRIDVSEQRRAVHHPLQPLEQCEIDDRGERYAAPQRPVTAEKRMVAEREDRTRDVHHQRAQRKGEDHRQQDARQNGHRPRRIDIPADFDQRNLVVGGDDHRRNGQRRAQQAEDQRHGSRRGKAHRVVDVEQDDIGQHHREVEDHHVAEREPRRIEHAAARHLHHAGRRDGADDDSHRRDGHDHPHGGRFGTDGRIEEVGGIVHHSDEETGHGEKRHGGQHKRIYRFHSVEFGQMRNKDSFFTRR